MGVAATLGGVGPQKGRQTSKESSTSQNASSGVEKPMKLSQPSSDGFPVRNDKIHSTRTEHSVPHKESR